MNKHNRHSRPLALVAAALLLFASFALSSCITYMPERPSVSWFDSLPAGKSIYFRLDVANNREFMREALKATGDGSLAAFADYCDSIYGCVDPEGAAREADDGTTIAGSPGSVSLIAVGNYPEYFVRQGLDSSATLKKTPEGWYENEKLGMTIAMPRGYMIALSKGGMKDLIARIEKPEHSEIPSEFASSLAGNFFSAYLPDPSNRLVARVMPDTALLPIIDGTVFVTKKPDGDFSLKASLRMASEREARVYLNIIKLAFKGIPSLIEDQALAVIFTGFIPSAQASTIVFPETNLSRKTVLDIIAGIFAPKT
jgi:hypothetical protein